MKIAKDTVVTVTYQLYAASLSEEKRHIETADANSPLVFLFGTGNMIPDFEANLLEKSAGEDFTFHIKAADAYGEVDAEAILDLPIDTFKVDGIIDFKLLHIGNQITLSDQNGEQVIGKVVAMETDFVKMDFNHPLAGRDLYFTGKVINVRAANPDELSHGHAHDGMNEH